MFTKSQIQQFKAKIASDDLDVLIKDLLKATTFDANLHNQVVMTANRFQEHEYARVHNLGDTAVNNQERAQITQALLYVIDQLPVDDSNVQAIPNQYNAANTTSNQGFSWTKWTGINDVKSWIAVIAGLAGILTFYFNFCQGDKKGKLINTTVFVENKKHELVLQQQGKIIMEVDGGESKQEDIDSKGSASFKNVKVGDKVRLKVNFSEPYSPIDSNALHTITADGRITLTVALQNLNRVFGTVIYRDQPLAGVKVVIGDLSATTDFAGSYKIQIPEQDQRKEQEVKFLKTGFKMLMKKAFPQTNEPLNIVMEK
jgi:hypothetical protein